jgi:dihydroxyacetone kinase-like predicted kinase
LQDLLTTKKSAQKQAKMCLKSTSESLTHLKNGGVIDKSFCELLEVKECFLEQKNGDVVFNFDLF